ncbi:hypothetical protein KAU32_02095 [bacterium]|nr:hypothetical protein [bacterium]
MKRFVLTIMISLGLTFFVYIIIWIFNIVKVVSLNKYLKKELPSLWRELNTSKIFGYSLFNFARFEKFLQKENINDHNLLYLRGEYKRVRNIGAFVLICFAVQILVFSIILAIIA